MKKVQNEAKELHLVSRSIDNSIFDEIDKKNHSKVSIYPVDLSEPNSPEELSKKILEKTHIDIIFNNAGLLTGDLLENLDLQDIDRSLSVNLRTPILLTRLFLPKMLENKNGLIINNASVSGEFYFPCAQVYAATKAGLTLFTKSLQLELKDTGVSTLLLVTPGIETKMMDQLKKEYSKHMELDFLEKTIPPDEWVDEILKSIKLNKAVCFPKGVTRFGLSINRHLPKVFEKIIMSKFKRNGK